MTAHRHTCKNVLLQHPLVQTMWKHPRCASFRNRVHKSHHLIHSGELGRMTLYVGRQSGRCVT
jgi:hypothetical protein